MTYRDPIPEPPPCPVCEGVPVPNRHIPETAGPWECVDCSLMFWGTTSEWERMADHRLHRARLREERDG